MGSAQVLGDLGDRPLLSTGQRVRESRDELGNQGACNVMGNALRLLDLATLAQGQGYFQPEELVEDEPGASGTGVLEALRKVNVGDRRIAVYQIHPGEQLGR